MITDAPFPIATSVNGATLMIISPDSNVRPDDVLDNKYELRELFGSTKPKWEMWSDEELQRLVPPPTHDTPIEKSDEHGVL